MLVGTLKQRERVLIWLFTPGSLLRVLRLKSLSSEVYHFKTEPRSEVAMLAFTRLNPWNLTRLCIYWTNKTTFL